MIKRKMKTNRENKLMPQFIGTNHTVCTGCRECEVVCSLFHFGESHPERSAIRIDRLEIDGLAESIPAVCQQCDDAPCVEACPMEALHKDGVTGTVELIREDCDGCEECIEACPIRCLYMDRTTDIVIHCDLCGGQPHCVDLCHSGCLTLEDSATTEQKNRMEILEAALEERQAHHT